MIFSVRYKDLIKNENGNLTDNICGDISFGVKEKIAKVLVEFAEPQIYHPSRYDNFTETTTALDSAGEQLNEIIGISAANFMDEGVKFSIGPVMGIASMFTPYLFDLIELQHNELSENEQKPFRETINDLFRRNNIPWVLADGKMVKIDAVQFEMDLKNKTEQLMLELKDAQPIFQPSYDELNKSLEFYDKGEYPDALLYAEKSYESVMKVCLGSQKGNAAQLTNQIVQNIHLPSSFKETGFKDNVLMSLPYLRNSLSGHGAGSEKIIVSKEIANLGINLACSLITYIVAEYRKKEDEKSD